MTNKEIKAEIIKSLQKIENVTARLYLDDRITTAHYEVVIAATSKIKILHEKFKDDGSDKQKMEL